MGARVISAGVIGALCGAGWVASIQPVNDAVCGGRGLRCLGTLFLTMPLMLVVFMAVGAGLLMLARVRPAWPTALGGPVGTVVLMLLAGLLGDLLQTNLLALLPFGATGSFAVVTGIGYALAAAVTAGYGGMRDRTEHRWQDG